jgi:hypothetical protein
VTILSDHFAESPHQPQDQEEQRANHLRLTVSKAKFEQIVEDL